MEPIITINEYPIGWEWLDKVPEEQDETTHSSRYQETKPPTLPPEPPKTDERPQDISRKQISIKGIGMGTVYL